MHPLHFIYYGTGKPDDANTRTPKALAAVHFWCMPQRVPEFEQALGKHVHVHGLDEILEAPLVRKELGALRDTVDQLLAFYRAHRGHAPAKDLLAFLTLGVHGGYFLDANCVIEDRGQFEKMLTRPPDVPTFLKLGDTLTFNARHPALMKDELALQMGMEEDPTDVLTPFNGTDLWAMFMPPRHPMPWTIVRHYLARAEAFGFCGSPVQAKSLRSQLRASFVEGIPLQKRTLAGALGIQSLYAGMVEHMRRDAGYRPEDVNWKVDAVKDGRVVSRGRALSPASADADYWVEALGITKGHGDSWTK